MNYKDVDPEKKPFKILPNTLPLKTIPREVAEEAYLAYCSSFGDSQSLDRLNQRGGFSVDEVIYCLYERIKTLKKQQ